MIAIPWISSSTATATAIACGMFISPLIGSGNPAPSTCPTEHRASAAISTTASVGLVARPSSLFSSYSVVQTQKTWVQDSGGNWTLTLSLTSTTAGDSLMVVVGICNEGTVT